jgi:hypothetical protein
VLKAGSRKAREAGRKAARTRARNKRLGKTTTRKTSRKSVGKTRRKGHVPKGFGKFTVSKEKLIAKLQAQKKTNFKPTEVVSLTWDVIRGHKKR